MKVPSKESRFLKGFSKIKVGKYCKEYKIDISNLQKGLSTTEKEMKVYNIIVKELFTLFASTIFDDEVELIECQTKK